MHALVDAIVSGCMRWWMQSLVDACVGGCMRWWMHALVDACIGRCIVSWCVTGKINGWTIDILDGCVNELLKINSGTTATQVHYDKEKIIINQHEVIDCLYVVARGQVSALLFLISFPYPSFHLAVLIYSVLQIFILSINLLSIHYNPLFQRFPIIFIHPSIHPSSNHQSINLPIIR